MKACRVHKFGGPEVITFEETDVPVPKKCELLVKVAAAGVGPWDAQVRSGKSVIDQPLPLTLGSDLCGVVVAAGPDTPRFGLGERVYGVTNARFTGAYAENAVAEAASLAAAPARASDLEAASLPVVTVTASQMLFDHAGLRAGERVLIHGAAGNVGAFATQLAQVAGAEVFATAVGPGVEYARRLAGERAVDMERTTFEREVPPVDVVIDTVGGDVQRRSFSVLKPGGRLVSSVSKPDAGAAACAKVRAAFMLVRVTSTALAEVARQIDAGALHPRVGAVLPLSEARVAHEMLAGRGLAPLGKIVLRVDAHVR